MQFPTPTQIERPFSVESERVNERIRLVTALRQRAVTRMPHEAYILEMVAGWIEKGEI
jgi:hypothetical protein